MTNKIFGSALKHIFVFVAVLLLLWFILVGSALIPNKAIYKNYESSVNSYLQKDAFEYANGKKLNAVSDNYADAIWLGVAWNMGVGNPVTASLATAYHDGEELGVNDGLRRTVTEGLPPNTDYTRYWHATSIFIRFLHLFTDVEGIKTVGFVAILILGALSAFMLIKKKHTDIALLLVVSLMAVHIWNVRLSLEYQPPFIISLLMLVLHLIFERRSDGALKILGTICGTLTAFFDFLTTETVTILLPLAVVIFVRAKEGRLGNTRQNFKLIFGCSVCWVLSYIGTFFAKWALSAMLFETSSLGSALDFAGIHFLGGNMKDIPGQAGSVTPFSGILANLTVLFGGTERIDTFRVLAGLFISGMVLFSIWYMFRRKAGEKDSVISLLILGAVVFLRFIVLNNHSYLHEFFVYRALATPIFAILSSLWLNISLPCKRRLG